MQIPKAILLILISASIIGCANTSHLTENLQKSNSDNYVIFKEDVSYIQKRGIGVSWKEGLLKGIYRPEQENTYGTYYRGPASCVVQVMDKHSMGPFEGGIWIPKDRINNSPRIYYYFNFNRDNAVKGGGLVVAGILSAYVGDITFMPPVDKGTFLDTVTVTNIPIE